MFKDKKRFVIGTGDLYINGRDVGQLKGDVKFGIDAKEYNLEAGFPSEILLQVPLSTEVTIGASLLEIDPRLLATIHPLMGIEEMAGGVVAVTGEYVSGVRASTWAPLRHRLWTEAAVTVRLASPMAASVEAGATKILVESARGFAPGNTISIRTANGATSGNATIAAGGVNAALGELTLSAGTSNAFAAGSIVENTSVTLAAGVDFEVDRICGGVTRFPPSAKLLDGDGASVAYSYRESSGTRLFPLAEPEDKPFRMEFVHKIFTDRGKRIRISFPNASMSSKFDFSLKEDKETLLDVSFTAKKDPVTGRAWNWEWVDA